MSKIIIGKIVKAQGLKGEVKVYPLADLSFFENLKEVYLNNISTKTQIQSLRFQQDMVIIKFTNVADRTMAEKMVGTELFLEREDFNLQEDEYLVDDLLGMNVLLDNNQDMGEIIEINNYGSADIFVVSGKFGKWQFPFLKDVVVEINKQKKQIILSKKRFDEVKV